MDSWQWAWRKGFAPSISTVALAALKQALETDDVRLLQGRTTSPLSISLVQDWPCEGGCAIGFCGMSTPGFETVAEVEEYFANLCYEADQRLGDFGECRWFLNWYDSTPREEMRRLLLEEVGLVLKERA